MEDKTYEKPEITDFGSLEDLTADCAAPGSGDFTFPTSLQHSTFLVTSVGICNSTP